MHYWLCQLYGEYAEVPIALFYLDAALYCWNKQSETEGDGWNWKEEGRQDFDSEIERM